MAVSIQGKQVSVQIDGEQASGRLCVVGAKPRGTSPAIILPHKWPPKTKAAITLGKFNGQFHGLNPFKGEIDEVAAWDVPLTDNQMKWLYTKFSAGKSYCKILGDIKKQPGLPPGAGRHEKRDRHKRNR